MRLPRTLTWYVVREIAQYTILGFLVFAAVLLSHNLVRTLGELAGTAGVRVQEVAVVAGLLLPVLATYAVPVSFLFGVLLAVGRLASDSEVKAMRACGLGLRELVMPALGLAVIVSLGTGLLMIRVEPEVRKQLRVVVKKAASRSLGVEPGRFRGLPDRVLFVRARDPDGQLRGVVIWDQSDAERPFVVFAERGHLAFDAERAVVRLDLQRGDLHLEPSGGDASRYRRIAFEKFDYAFDVGDFLAGEASRLRPRDMTMSELRANLARVRAARDPSELVGLREREPGPYEIQLHRRYALPLAPIVFALVAVPLALHRVRGARSFGAMLCVALAFLYYALLSLAEFLGEERSVPASLAMWIPNAAFLVLAIPLLLRARRGEV